jgi:DNA-binding beta-propeller fold protein YncE
MLPAAGGCSYDQLLPPCGLLYVSDYARDDVLVFERDKLVGTLTGFEGPDGLCSDRLGNVWITNNAGGSIYEYAHRGTKRIASLSDPGVYPLGCAVNPITGALAVTNISSYGTGAGSVAIYHKATGKPLILSDPDIYFVYFCAYDAAGNLYIDGLNSGGMFQFAELPRGEFKFKSITLNGTVNFPGDVKWDGRHIVVGDQRYEGQSESALYRTSGASGEILGTTVLSGAQDIVGYWIHTNSVIGADVSLREIDLYHYPEGGEPGLRLHHFIEPYGVTVSIVRSPSADPAVRVPSAYGTPGAAPVRRAATHGWFAAPAAPGRLVYVAAGNEVLIYAERDRDKPPVGEITDGVEGAYGLCTDRHGNLYVANADGDSVTVYPPGKTSPSRTYTGHLSRPLYPLVDREGQLWVGNANGAVVEFSRDGQVEEVLKTAGNEADGMDFDSKGNLYVAYRTSYDGAGSIEEFTPGSTQGTILGMSLNQPQGVIVTSEGTILAVETGGYDRIDVFPAGYTVPVLEVGVQDIPTQLAITRSYGTLFVSNTGDDAVYVSPFPLLNPKGSPNALHKKIEDNGQDEVQGVALSNGQVF